jgi:sporulation protein YlmC with PRC-barrel domain
MGQSTVENKIFNIIKSSISAAEAAEKFLAPQRGRPVKDLENELKVMIDKYSNNIKGQAVVMTAKAILEKMNSQNDLPQFSKPVEKSVEKPVEKLPVPVIRVKKIGDDYIITKSVDGFMSIYKYSQKQRNLFKSITKLLDKHFPE